MDDYAKALADGIDAALPTWVVGCVTALMTAWEGQVPPEVAEAAEVAAQDARREVGGAVRALLDLDIDEQWTTPLALVRTAVRYPARILAAAGVGAVERDEADEALFPDDVYDLTPATWADLDPDLAEVGLAWSAAKAFEHKRRHRP